MSRLAALALALCCCCLSRCDLAPSSQLVHGAAAGAHGRPVGVPGSVLSRTAAHYACADVFVFPSLTDTFGLVILEAWAAGTPVAAFPAPGPIDMIPGSGVGVLAASQTEGLKEACLDALKIDRSKVRGYAEQFSWRACAEDFRRFLQPYPEPEKSRFWRRLRRLARLRRGPRPAA